MRLDLCQQQTLLEEGNEMTWLDIVAVLALRLLKIGFVEHGESRMMHPHFHEVLVHNVVDLIAFENYAHLTNIVGERQNNTINS